MDTIQNLTNAATKAIWGEQSHEEPVSGKMGNVDAGEPYDAGNIGGTWASFPPFQHGIKEAPALY